MTATSTCWRGTRDCGSIPSIERLVPLSLHALGDIPYFATGRPFTLNDRTNLLQIDDIRLWDTMMASARIGPGRDRGLRRLALDASDKEMRDLFVAWCRDTGAEVSVDKMGNIFARREGRENAAAPVLGGQSPRHAVHRRQVRRDPRGARRARDPSHPRRSRHRDSPAHRGGELVERGGRPIQSSDARFGRLRGSACDIEWAWARTDNDGVTYGNALAAIGYVGDAEMGGRDIDAYFELHIEQGPILEAEGIAVGVVTHGYATRGMRLRITGETAHTGPTPMDQRRNALVGAAYLIAAVNDIGWKYHLEGGKSTASPDRDLAQRGRDPAGVRAGEHRLPPPGSGGCRAHAGRCGGRDRRLRKARQC